MISDVPPLLAHRGAHLEQLLEHGVEEAGQVRQVADARVRADGAREAAAPPGL